MELVVEAAEVVCDAAEVAVVREAEFVVAEVEEDSAVVDDSEESVVDESEDPVVAVEAEDSLAVVDSWEASVELDDFSLQTTWSGVETPAEEQICLAYWTAWVWASLSQAETRQHAMPLRKSAFLQIQAMSSCPQPAIEVPVVNWVTQPVYDCVSVQLLLTVVVVEDEIEMQQLHQAERGLFFDGPWSWNLFMYGCEELLL